MKKINFWLRNVLGFSQAEINGFRILTLLLVLALAAPFLYGLISADTPSTTAADIRKLDSLTAILEKPENSQTITGAGAATAHAERQPLSAFDPNLLNTEQWQALGLQKSLAQRIVNYCQKGGKFRTKKDLLKIYGFPAEEYARLSSYILLPDTLTYAAKREASVPTVKGKMAHPVRAEKSISSFDLNLADSVQLMEIKGIGPGLSRRIIRYREKLGGFVSEGQLREVYGLDSLVVQELLKYGTVSVNPVIQKLAVNTATVQELAAHPYISPKIASIMVDYRKQHGPYASPENLYKIRALDKATLDKLIPYLHFE